MSDLKKAYAKAYYNLDDKNLCLFGCLESVDFYYFRFGDIELIDGENIIVNKENGEVKNVSNDSEELDKFEEIELNEVDCRELLSLNEFTMYKYNRLNINELADLMDLKENIYTSEEAVVNYFKELYFNNIDDMDLLNDINTLFYVRGYNVMFLMPLAEHKKEFDLEEYKDVSKGLTNSFEKTFEFIKYLNDLNSFRISNLSLYLINIRHLVDANILDINNAYIKECYEKNLDLRETLFQDYMSIDSKVKEAIKDIKEKVLVLLGGYGTDFNAFPHYEFLVDTEFMLYSIGDFKKTNMIKLMFKIVNKEHLMRTKNQYSTKYFEANKYLGNIKKEYFTWYIEKHSKEHYENDGYVQFYRHLEMR